MTHGCIIIMSPWASALFMDDDVLWNLRLSFCDPKKNSEWVVWREAGKKRCEQAKKGNFTMTEGVCVWFLAYSSSTFLKVHTIWDQLICNMIQYGNLHISFTCKVPGGAMLHWGGLGFEHMVLIFFWKYINFPIDWYIIW